jgi:hypothetical protein
MPGCTFDRINIRIKKNETFSIIKNTRVFLESVKINLPENSANYAAKPGGKLKTHMLTHRLLALSEEGKTYERLTTSHGMAHNPYHVNANKSNIKDTTDVISKDTITGGKKDL